MRGKRSQYRTVPQPWWNLQVWVAGSGDEVFPAEVLDISGGGIRLGFEEDTAPAVELGCAVTVRLKADDLPQSIDAAAVVVRTEKDGIKRFFGLQFIDWMGLVAAVPKSVAALFNLRAHPRLAMDPALPVEVAVRGFDDSFDLRGVLCDVSRGGLSFCTQLLSQCVLNRVDYCIVEFTLPGLGQRFVFGSCIRYGCLSGESLRYGVWFDPEYTDDFPMQQVVLGHYVDKRLEAALGNIFVP